MRVIPLGTSSAVPAHGRHLSAVAVLLDGRWLLLDCGEGTQYRVSAAGLRTHQLECVFITHLHGDHIFGLPGLLSTMTMQNRRTPLPLYGPRGLRSLVENALEATSMRSAFPLQFHELTETTPRHLRETRWYSVETLALDHRVPAFGYRISETTRRTVAYCTDTRPCENAALLGRHADLLIHEATYTSALSALAHERGHSTAQDAAGVALRARPRGLLLTHFSSRYSDPDLLVREAREIFPPTDAARELLPISVEPPARQVERPRAA